MHRQPGVSGFPSMAGFMGEKPNKRPRMQEPQREKTFADMRIPAAEVAEEEVWEDLDDDAMEECMLIATQMCTEPPEDHKGDIGLTVNLNDRLGSPTKKDGVKNNQRNDNHASKHMTIDHLDDSGFSSTKGTGHNNSKIFYNPMKNKSTTSDFDNSKKNNSYASRFNDFAALPNSQKLSSGMSKPAAQNSGRVYNSIPMKVGGMGITSRGPPATSSASNKCMAKDISHGIRIKTEDGSSHGKLIKTEVDDRAMLQEDVLMKQGEISMLRAELQRKEAALEAERLDRYTAIEAAEKRGKEKTAAVALEAEAKTKECNRTIERLQGELHFKNREVQELETQCRRLEMQSQQQGTAASPSSTPRSRISPKLSPKKSCSNFKDRFDFTGNSVKMKNIEVQTDSMPKESRKRCKLDVTVSKGKWNGSRRIACLFSHEKKEGGAESLTHYKNRWTLDDNWASLLSQIITDCEDSNDVQKQLLNISIQRLEEVHALLVSQRIDTLRPPTFKTTSPVEVYECHVVPALSVIKCLTTSQEKDQSQKAIQAVCSHLPSLSFKDDVLNSRIWPLILQAIEQVCRLTPHQMDRTICQLILERLRDCCERVNSSKELVTLLQVLQALAQHKHFMNFVCTKEDNCFIGKLCSVINSSQSEEPLIIATTLQEWLSLVFMDSPPWLYSSCSCSAKLLATLLRQIHFTVDWAGSKRGSQRADLNKLLISTIQLLHCWSTTDPSWWEKVARLPHYTVVMGTIIDSAKEIQADRQTVDLLCDLYEFDEKIFENC